MSDTLRRITNLVAAPLLFAASSFSVWSGIGTPVGADSNLGGFSIETPAGYAFAIWGPIFLLTLVYAVRQALPSQATSAVYRRIGWLTAASSLLLSAWMLIAQIFGNNPVLVVIIWTLLALAATTLLRLVEMRPSLDRFDRWVTSAAAGLLTGWLSAAVWLNVSGLIRQTTPDRFGVPNVAFGLIVLGCVTAAAWALLIRSRGQVWQAAALVWAFIGVVVANLQSPSGAQLAVIVAALAAVLTVALAAVLNRKSRPAAA
jgi:hypothetical protein